MKTLFLFLLLILAFSFNGCFSAKYVPPVQSNDKINFTKEINRSFDDTWTALIDYAAGTFFAIDNYEKASGLITLSFSANRPSDYVTGGTWNSSGTINFNGDYVDYLRKYYGAQLNGKINIVVNKLAENKTKITVNVRYILTSPINANSVAVDTWSFDSGNCATTEVTNAAPGTSQQRIICPTYKIENDIISAIEHFDIVEN